VLEAIGEKPFLVAIIAGTIAQLFKVVAFLVAERHVNYRRFVQTDGAPNLHSTAFAALTTAVGKSAGFGSIAFGIALCLTAIILVDTMNVKNATSRQKQAMLLILDRVRQRAPRPEDRTPHLSYTPWDVFSGVVVGVGVALIF
jgi:acid phosphatase family membrane protein YuiD